MNLLQINIRGVTYRKPTVVAPPDPNRRFWLFNSSGTYNKQPTPTWNKATGEIWDR